MNIFFILFKICSLLPLALLRFFFYILYFINKYTFKYRYATVINNLTIAFPEKDLVELIEIRDSFYKYFFNLIAEIVKFISINKSRINKKVEIVNPEIIDEIIAKNKSVILLSSHYNNWEWGFAKVALSFDTQCIGIYKKLNSNFFNNLLIRIRERFGTKVISMQDSLRYILNNKNTPQIIGIIADQNPVVTSSTNWLSFFGKEVPVFMGAEKLARKLDFPVVFGMMEKDSINKYYITFEVLESNPNKSPDGDITKRYLERLEKQINKQPSYWLWTHRRWKHKK